MTHLKVSAVQVGWVPLAVGWVSASACSEVAGRMGCEGPCTHLQEREGSLSATNQGPTLLWAMHLSSVGLKQLWGPTHTGLCPGCSGRPGTRQSTSHMNGDFGGQDSYPLCHAEEKEAYPGVRLRVGLGVESAGDPVHFGSSWTCAPHWQHSFSWAAPVSGQPSFSLSCSASSSGLWREMAF